MEYEGSPEHNVVPSMAEDDTPTVATSLAGAQSTSSDPESPNASMRKGSPDKARSESPAKARSQSPGNRRDSFMKTMRQDKSLDLDLAHSPQSVFQRVANRFRRTYQA
ncbi:hypothetical protein CYMTET_38201 [Cymbomonas tetramitiformis]|nr:hypothetical protein CYMTET_38201 [Cymbomonas tetramitiformis]